MSAKFTALEHTRGIRLRARFRLHWFSVSPSGGENPNFAVFGLRHLMVSPIGSSLRKLNTGAQLQTFPYPIRQNRFYISTPSWRNRVRNL